MVTDPIALSYGMGVDSTAVLVGWWRRTGVKGTRGGEKKPGSWHVFLAEHAPEVLPELPPEQPQPQPTEPKVEEAA